MDVPESAPAPQEALTPSPDPISAVEAAVGIGDVSAFRDAKRAEREGKPLPAVTPEPAAEPLPPVERTLSKRQQEANDRTREAVERATADLRAENDRLRRGQAPPPVAPAPVTAAPSQKDYERYLALPDAPKLEDFDDLNKHAAAVAVFIADQRYEEREAARLRTERDTKTQQTEQTRLSNFDAKIRAAKEKDPTFLDRTQAIGAQMVPARTIQRHNATAAPADRLSIGPLNSLADELLDADAPDVVMAHLADHPEELDRFKAMTSAVEVTRAFAKLEASLVTPSKTTPLPKTITDAPSPPPTLGGKPAASSDELTNAVATGDVVGYRRARLAQRAALMR